MMNTTNKDWYLAALIIGVIGWATIETLIWLFGFLHVSIG